MNATIERARAAILANDAAGALRLATTALAAAPTDPDALEVGALAARMIGDVAQAERLLRRAIAAVPGRRWSYDDLAELLIEAGRTDEAEQVARAAIAADPDNANATMALGNLLSEREELVAGAALLRHAIALAGEHPQLLANLGRNLQRQGALAEAEPLLRKAVAAMPEALPPLAWLAELLEQARRFDEAASMLDQAERLAKTQGSDVTLQRARLLSRTSDWARGLALLDAEPRLSGAALLQRGRLRDRAGRYHEAWQDFVAGKQTLSAVSGRRYDRGEVQRTIVRMEGVARSGRSPAPVRHDIPQPIFILGFPRSGTTLTEQVLASHSRIRAGGELPFVTDLAAIAAEADGADLGMVLRDAYLVRAEAYGLLAPDTAFFTDKMPLNELYLPLLRLAFPASPLVAVSRHPLDVMISAMSHDFTHGFNCGYRLGDLAEHYAAVDALAAHWHQTGPVHTLRYERFVAAQVEETATLMAAIALPMEDAQLRFHESRRFAPTPSYSQVQEPLNDRSIGRWHAYSDALEPIRNILTPAIARGGYAA